VISVDEVPFDYYESLSSRDKAIYAKSDRVTSVGLAGSDALARATQGLRAALESEKTRGVQEATACLCLEMTRALGVAPIEVEVLARRPTSHGEELHGIYRREDSGAARVEVWMRTAKHRRVVTFRTYLRTLVHEICHHLDFELLHLDETFHTAGFFKRESSLVNALAPKAARMIEAPTPAPEPDPPKPLPEQLSLFDH